MTSDLQRNPDTRSLSARQRDEPVETQHVVLLVEDSPIVARLVTESIQSSSQAQVQLATSLAEASRLLDSNQHDYLAAVVCLSLPDASNGEAVDLATSTAIPTIVLTGDYDEATREKLLAKPIVDYFIKKERSLAGLNFTLQRLRENAGVEVLVVDDSRTQRAHIRQLLDAHGLGVHEAEDGFEAFEILDRQPTISLVITDYEMPGLNGVDLVARLRDRWSNDELSVVGLSATGIGSLPARYLKHGADDFLTKPFGKEEFYCRIYRSLVGLQQIKAIKKAAFCDSLTGLPNRLAFFRRAPKALDDAIADGIPAAVAMIDVDNFKRVNDTFGHGAGDEALRRLADVIDRELPAGVLAARTGGEEFCCLATNTTPTEALDVCESLRSAVERIEIGYEEHTFRITASFGVCCSEHTSLEDSMNRADRLLYDAKRRGRNRVVTDASADGPLIESAKACDHALDVEASTYAVPI